LRSESPDKPLKFGRPSLISPNAFGLVLATLVASVFMVLLLALASHKPRNDAVSAWPTSDWNCEHIGDPGAVVCNRNAPPMKGLPH
jgi:hypothetical protein